ncbi:MAG TPA: ribosome rescue protein RqcH [Thermoplasmata archaeon]|jgi:predicted ribosome quality control (RQC) complex YloA/Tae2 family protein|nr:ribosome rescue protein RqcH [Thermoplasmata archaeon]
MKDGLSSFDVLAVTAELQALVGGHLDKVYQKEDELTLKVNMTGGGRHEVYAKVGKWLCLRGLPEKPVTPPPFAMALRRHLDNARITGVEQRGFDRIVTFSFDRGTRLVFELFGKGNVVLVDGETTVAAFHRQTFKDRKTGPGAVYGFPPATANPFEMTRDAFAAAIVAAKGSVVKVLAGVMNLGGQWGEEVLLRAGIEKTAKLADPDDEKLTRIHEILRDLHRQVREAPEPRVVFESGVAVDVTPIPLKQHAPHDYRGFPTFSEALSFYLDQAPAPPTPIDNETAKFRRRIEQQEKTLEEARAEAVRSASLAEFLYAHYAMFDELIRKAREGTLAIEGPVLAVDPARHIVRLAVADVTELEIDWTKDVNGNAQVLYTRKRDAEEKAVKVLAAIEETKRELEKVAKKAAKAATKPRVKATKAFWFEAYRWFLSSEDFLVIGGRDAKTNDAIVKKHLQEGDRYVHADLHGAPSCVVKRGSEAGEATLREACAFALAYSKAWSAGLASGGAFWVLPEQVSKQAESGEHVARGAWVIRGKRNYVHDIPVRAAVGEVDVEGQRKVMGGPVEALAARSSRYLVIEPGDGDKESFAGRLSHDFGVPVEEVSRVLPPGKIHVVETHGGLPGNPGKSS